MRGVDAPGNARNSSGWPSGSRNLYATMPMGRVCGPSVEIDVHCVDVASRVIARSMSGTTIAKCWNSGLQPGTSDG